MVINAPTDGYAIAFLDLDTYIYITDGCFLHLIDKPDQNCVEAIESYAFGIPRGKLSEERCIQAVCDWLYEDAEA